MWQRISTVSQRDLFVFPVEYASPVGLAIPPDTVVLGVAGMSPSSVEDSFRELLFVAQTLS